MRAHLSPCLLLVSCVASHVPDPYERDRLRYDFTHPPSEASVIELEYYDLEMAWATCRAFARCGQLNSAGCPIDGPGICQAFTVEECAQRIFPRSPSTWVAAALLGDAVFDGAAARACVTRLDASICTDILVQQNDHLLSRLHCDEAFEGQRQLGERCTHEGCAAGLYCAGSSCQPALPEQASCRPGIRGQCGRAATCANIDPVEADMFRCLRLRAAGEACVEPLRGIAGEVPNLCQSGLVCADTCQPLRLATRGESCSNLAVCEGGSHCSGGVCVADLPVGTSCTLGYEDPCIDDAYCAGNRCQRAAVPGEACINDQCASGLRCAQHQYCVVPLPVGAPCERAFRATEVCTTYCDEDNRCAPRYELRSERWL